MTWLIALSIATVVAWDAGVLDDALKQQLLSFRFDVDINSAMITFSLFARLRHVYRSMEHNVDQ